MMDEQTIKNLYKQYLNRDANAGELSQFGQAGSRYSEFDTPEKLTNLLSSTASSQKSTLLKNATDKRDALVNSGPATGGPTKPPEFSDYTNNFEGYNEAMTDYGQSSDEYGQIRGREMATPDRVRGRLKSGKGAHYFGETMDDMKKKYADPESPWYIADPNARGALIKRAQDEKLETMNDVVTKVQSIYSVLSEAAKNETAAKKDKVDMILKNVEKSYDTLLAIYGEEMADVRANDMSDKEFGQNKDLMALQQKYDLEKINATPGPGTDNSNDTQTPNGADSGAYWDEIFQDQARLNLDPSDPEYASEEQIINKLVGKYGYSADVVRTNLMGTGAMSPTTGQSMETSQPSGGISGALAPLESGISPWDVTKQLPSALWDTATNMTINPKTSKKVWDWFTTPNE